MRPEVASENAPLVGDALEAAATLASRTSVGAETAGADGKAAIVLSLLGIMFAVLARFGAEVGELLRTGVGTGTGIIRITCGGLLLGFVLSALAAVLQAFRTITPRFRKDKPSLALFSEIAAMELDEYAGRVGALTMENAVDEILRYNHTAAAICAEKFKQLGRCLRYFEVASACWLVLVAVVVYKALAG
jgi:hypothetical protein